MSSLKPYCFVPAWDKPWSELSLYRKLDVIISFIPASMLLGLLQRAAWFDRQFGTEGENFDGER